jgi:O-acetyl-ADP-ribose deacetylase (regulator of RNase III)
MGSTHHTSNLVPYERRTVTDTVQTRHSIMVNNTEDATYLAKIIIQQPQCMPFSYFIRRGSVITFSPDVTNSGIVVASNENCTSAGGVSTAVIKSGGGMLVKDIEKLPKIENEKRCLPGQAVVVGKNKYGDLKVPYVIFAVAPRPDSNTSIGRKETLVKAYQNALEIAKFLKLQSVAFSLIGTGNRGGLNRKEAIKIGVHTIYNFSGYPELSEIHHFAYDAREAHELKEISNQLLNEVRYRLTGE